MKYISHPSPNFNDRPDSVISAVVLHYTGMPTAQDALERLSSAESQVSSHYLIDEDGAVYSLVPEEKRAWHSGRSSWRGQVELNDYSIGIEIVNPGHDFGYRDFPAVQMQAVEDLCREIVARHQIPARNVVAHSDIAPLRKTDPGELFDWQRLALAGVGVWAHVPAQSEDDEILLKPDFTSAEVSKLQECLVLWGYTLSEREKYGSETQTVVSAFQRHFNPKFLDGVWRERDDRILTELLQKFA